MEKFAEYLRINAFAEVTIKNYVCRVSCFLKGLNPEEMTQDKVNNFFLGISKNASAYNGYIHAISAYSEFANRGDIKLPKRLKETHNNLEVITEAEFENEVIQYIPYVRHHCGEYSKTIALACLFFDTDIKIEELVNLSRDTFDLRTNTVIIRASKKRPERILPYSNRTGQAIYDYFNEEPEEETNAFNTSSHSLKTKFYRLKREIPYRNFSISLLQRSGKAGRRTK